MKPMSLITLIFLFSSLAISAKEEPTHETISLSTEHDGRLPGVTFSEGLGQITGTAISPLLGVSAVGAWEYYNTDSQMRSHLPWYSSPWAWVSFGTILIVCFLKDTFGTILPAFLKKPMDIVELFENKASALVASVGFVPSVVSQMNLVNKDLTETTAVGAFPAFLLISDINWALIPFFILSFMSIFLLFNIVNILILLSPFGFIDALLKLIRTGLIMVVLGSYFISPHLGLSVSLLLIIISVWLAPKTMRISVFGTLFAWDTILNIFRSHKDHTQEFTIFTVKGGLGLPLFTKVNALIDDKKNIRSGYSKWVITGYQEVDLDFDNHVFETGFTFSSIYSRESNDRIGILLPRTTPSLPAISNSLGMPQPTEGLLVRTGNRGIYWFRELLGRSKSSKVEHQNFT